MWQTQSDWRACIDVKKKILLFFLPIIGYLICRIIYISCKKRFVLSDNIPEEPSIIAFWHGELLMQPFLYNHIRKNHKITVMISEHTDGEIISRLISFFGFESSRGSARRNGAKALLSSIRKMEDGYDVGITPDGPKGPRHSVAEGIVAIAKKRNAKIIPFNIKASSFWQLSSWDKFVIPKPFSTITFFAGEPIYIDNLDNEQSVLLIKNEMLKNAIL